MKSVWLTRSYSQNLELEQQLKFCNFKLINQPLITYVDYGKVIDENVINRYTSIIVTSKHAAKIIVNSSLAYRKAVINVWVVGDNSAMILKQAGFKIEFIAINVEHLITNLPQSLYNKMIYLSANIITQMLPKEIKRLIIYLVKYNIKLSPNKVSIFKQGIDYILLYSKNCANTLIQVMNRYHLYKLKKSTIIALSSKIAQEISPYFDNVLHCDIERHNTIIELLIKNEKYAATI
ncbi:MAG: hypothetical protein EOP33_05040 [Rickettsiaceae bacterium]|nr:MAG: hypothetical protein EOP33_05040 [Rickettsiaceae bacterium]